MQRLWRVLCAVGLAAIWVCVSGSVVDAATVTVFAEWNPETDVAPTLTISWNSNGEPDVIGYKVSWGNASQQYSTTIDVGNVTSYMFGGADPTLSYYFAVQAYNVGGLVSPYSTEASWAASPPPTVSISAPAGGTSVSGSIAVTASASASAGMMGVQFTLDGAVLGGEDTTAPYSVSWNTAGAANGGHTLTAIARDAAGTRTTSVPVTVTVNNDTTPPVISAVTPASITASGATVTWTTDEPSDSQVDFGLTTAYGSTSAWNGALVTTHAVSLTGLTAGTLYHLRVRSRDPLGNLGVSGDVTLITLTVNNNDTTPPVISAVTPASITASGATVTWTTDEPSDSQVDFGLTTAFGSTSAWNGALVTAHAVSLTGLTAGTLYHLRVRSRDPVGNLGVSGDVTLITLAGAPPVVSIMTPVGGTTVSGSIAVTASANAGVMGVQFTLDGGAFGDEDTTVPYSVSWNTAAASNGSHTLTATARDAAGMRTTSAPVTVTVNHDTTPPVISAVTLASITASGATVTWTTDEASDSQVDFGLTTAYGSTSNWDGALVTAHAVSLTGLTEGTLYHVRVRSRDAAGNLALSADVIVRRTFRGDADGDGKADLTIYRPSIGTWFTRQSSTDYGTASSSVQWGLNDDLPVPGDYDGDGGIDFAVYRPANGVWYISQSTTNFATSMEFQWGSSSDIPVVGDYDGDGRMDLIIYRPASGVWYIRPSATNYATSVEFQWGQSADVPVPADYDGDGKMDLAIYRPANGVWYLCLSSTNYATSAEFQWGLSDDITVPGDFDGDGKTDLAVWRPSSGVWFIRQSTTGYASSVAFQWGLSGDIPVPGDFDGDGKVDLAVFRPSIGTWFLRLSSTNFTTSSSWQWGLAGDIPILSRR